jgi:hypothetical protein
MVRSKLNLASRNTSVSVTGASVTARSPPAGRTSATRPTARLVTYMTLPGLTLEAPRARPSMVHVSPSELADRIAVGPPSTKTTSGWYVIERSRTGPYPYDCPSFVTVTAPRSPFGPP